MALYDKFGVPEVVQAFGRCIGHGGMPVDRHKTPDITDCRCVVYDNRRYENDENLDIGYNGFANLVFHGPELKIQYFDLYNTRLLTERWTTDDKGNLLGPELSNVRQDLVRDEDYLQQHQPSPTAV